MTRGRQRHPSVNTLGGVVGALVMTLALVRELRRPPESRTWHGTVLGFVPYDFRRPTLGRVRRAWWSPEDDHLLLPRAFGVGWSINLARVGRVMSRGCCAARSRDAGGSPT